MRYWGRILGAIFGYGVFGLFGLILGFYLGYIFDRNRLLGSINQDEVKNAFFKALFTSLGALSKSDGVVSTEEINAARAIMAQMQLSPSQVKLAIEYFNQGKGPDYAYQKDLKHLYEVAKGTRSLMRMFLQLQFQAAYSDGALNTLEAKVLADMAGHLGYRSWEFQQMQAMFQAQYQFGQFQQGRGGYSSGSYQRQSGFQYGAGQNEIDKAYAVLGVAKTATKAEIKSAYRKLMNQYHPDKLVSKGLPDEMMQVAKEKSQNIQAAYDLLKRQA